MNVSVRISRGQTRTRGERRVSGPARRPERGPEPDAPQVSAAAKRARAAGGPQDRALYHCECGYMFHADVSASVGCPRCGGEQAW